MGPGNDDQLPHQDDVAQLLLRTRSHCGALCES